MMKNSPLSLPQEPLYEGNTPVPITVLLIDDQMIIAEALKRMLFDQSDITFHYCTNPGFALEMISQVKPTVILQDLVMPDCNGLTLVQFFRSNASTFNIPIIVLSTREDPIVKADAFSKGANDYIVKIPDKIELIARIRYHSMAYTRLLERNEAYKKIEESQRQLNLELSEAAAYVRTLLPDPIDDHIKVDWRFLPSAHLGGDAFGYRWVDPHRFAFYLLDVCGHGVGAALLSISVLNVILYKTLPNVDFTNPKSVLTSLNQTFQMEDHNNMFFTIWYGVYDSQERTITYSSGGHPPVLMLSWEKDQLCKLTELQTSGIAIGAVENIDFENKTISLDSFNKLFLYSDGIYEITTTDGSILTINEFKELLKATASKDGDDLDRLVRKIQSIQGKEYFVDDVSIIEFKFRSSN